MNGAGNGGGEEWRAIAGAPGYEVSDWGRVRSYHARKGWRTTPRVMRLALGRRSLAIGLHYATGAVKRKSIHRLVLEAFRGPCPPKCEGCHNDGNWRNNRLENLRWDTHVNNMADCVKHNTRLKGDRHPNSKLNPADRAFVRELLRRGFPLRWIAVLYGVHEHTVRKAKRIS